MPTRSEHGLFPFSTPELFPFLRIQRLSRYEFTGRIDSMKLVNTRYDLSEPAKNFAHSVQEDPKRKRDECQDYC